MQSDGKPIFWAALLVAFLCSCGMGANDISNSMATSVGSGALSLRSAILIASVCELGGAVLLGRAVSAL